MRKLSLQVESLEVESFQTAPMPPARGTVLAHGGPEANPDSDDAQVMGWPEQPPPRETAYPDQTCYGTCYFSCGCSLPC
jgi:hypothetical protein